METINAWNRDTRFGKAFLDEDLDAVIEFDVNLEHGVSRDNLDAGLRALEQHARAASRRYIGY